MEKILGLKWFLKVIIMNEMTEHKMYCNLSYNQIGSQKLKKYRVTGRYVGIQDVNFVVVD